MSQSFERVNCRLLYLVTNVKTRRSGLRNGSCVRFITGWQGIGVHYLLPSCGKFHILYKMNQEGSPIRCDQYSTSYNEI